MGGVYRNAAGDERYVHDDEIQSAVKAGWAPRDETTFTAPTGEQRTLSPDQVTTTYGSAAPAPDYAYTGDDALGAVLRDRLLQEEYGGFGDQVLTGLEGAASAVTFSGSDWLLDELGAGTAERAEANPGTRLGGEIVGGIGAVLVPGGVGSLTAKGAAALGGGLKGRMAAEALEGLAFGVAQGSSNIALSNIPLSGEAYAEELITNGLYGLGFGAVGGAAGHAAGGLANKMKVGREAREAAASKLKDLADAPIGGFSPEEGAQVVSKWVEGANGIEKAATNAAEAAQMPITGKDMIYSYRMSRQLMEEAGISPDGGFGSMLVDPKTIVPELRTVKQARAGLKKLYGENDLFDRAGMADAGGLQLISNAPETWTEAAKHLDDLRTAAESISKKAGLSGHTGAAKFVSDSAPLDQRFAHAGETLEALEGSLPEKRLKKLHKLMDAATDSEDPAEMAKLLNRLDDALEKATATFPTPYAALGGAGKIEMQGADATAKLLADDPHIRIKQVATGGRKIGKRATLAVNGAEDIGQALKAQNALTESMNKAWGLSGKKPLTDMAFSAFLKMKPDKALVAAETYGQWITGLEKFAAQFDDGASAVAAKQARESLKEAMSLLAKNPEFGNLSGAEMLANLAGKAEVPPISPDGDDLLKVWLMDRMSRQAADVGAVIPKGASKDKLVQFLEAGLSSAGHRAGAQAVRNFIPGGGGSTLLGKVLQGFGAAGGGMLTRTIGGLVGGGQHIAQSTGKHIHRIANATENLARGVNKRSRVLAPTATALLNKYPFGEEPTEAKQSKNLQELYKRRMAQLAEMAANPQAAQLKIHNNLEPVRQVNALLADHLEMQAMNDAQHLFETAPKDPGFMHRMGISVWKPSEDDIVRWASRFRALDPAGVWERVVGGRVTPQEAETLKKIRPETYTEIQRQISHNLPEIQAKCTFDQRNRMMLCFDVPTDPLNSKHTVAFVQNQFLERATGPDGEPVQFDGAGFKPEEPTTAQQFQTPA